MTDFTTLFDSFGGQFTAILSALAILIIGWLIASSIRKVVANLLKKTDLDNKLMSKTGSSSLHPEKFIAKLVYYLIMLVVLLIVLEKLGITDVLDPLKNMLNEFVGYIPNMIAAGIIGFAGYVIATIASEVVGFAGNFLDNFSSKVGLSSTVNLSKLLKQLVFIIVFIPLLIAAIDALGIKTISEPAKAMLGDFISVIPKLIAAAAIIGVFYIIGKMVTGMGADLLKNLGTDKMAANLGLSSMIGNASPSKLIANTGFFFIMFTGIVAAVDMLDIQSLSAILSKIYGMVGGIFFGLLIMAIGAWLSNLVYKTMSKNKDNAFLATLARVAVIGLFVPMALSSMGIGTAIVNTAFSLILGAVAVAFALSFGLGGREAAGKVMSKFFDKLN